MLTGTMMDRWKEAIVAAWNEGKFDAMDEFYASNFVRHQPPFPDAERLEGYKQFIEGVRVTCPDAHITIDQIIHEGDWSAYVGSWRGTWTGPWAPFPNATPNGQKIDFAWCGMVHWVGDKLVEERVVNDWLTVMLQSGLVTWPS